MLNIELQVVWNLVPAIYTEWEHLEEQYDISMLHVKTISCILK